MNTKRRRKYDGVLFTKFDFIAFECEGMLPKTFEYEGVLFISFEYEGILFKAFKWVFKKFEFTLRVLWAYIIDKKSSNTRAYCSKLSNLRAYYS